MWNFVEWLHATPTCTTSIASPRSVRFGLGTFPLFASFGVLCSCGYDGNRSANVSCPRLVSTVLRQGHGTRYRTSLPRTRLVRLWACAPSPAVPLRSWNGGRTLMDLDVTASFHAVGWCARIGRSKSEVCRHRVAGTSPGTSRRRATGIDAALRDNLQHRRPKLGATREASHPIAGYTFPPPVCNDSQRPYCASPNHFSAGRINLCKCENFDESYRRSPHTRCPLTPDCRFPKDSR